MSTDPHKSSFESDLSKAFEGHREPVDPAVWEGIAAGIAPTPKRRVAAWWWWGAAASIAILLTAGAIFWANGPSAGDAGLASQPELPLKRSTKEPGKQSELQEDPMANPAEQEGFATSTDSPATVDPTTAEEPAETPAVKSTGDVETDNPNANAPKSSVASATGEQFTTGEKDVKISIDMPEVQPKKVNAPSNRRNIPRSQDVAVAQVAKAPGSTASPNEANQPGQSAEQPSEADRIQTLKLMGIDALAENREQPKVYMPLDRSVELFKETEVEEENSSQWMLAANLLSSNSGGPNGGNFLAQESAGVSSNNLQSLADRSSNPDSDREFGAAILTSITANYFITRRLSIETGLSHSIYTSSSERPVRDYNGNPGTFTAWYSDRYFGIPLRLNYFFVQKRKWGLFAGGGFAIEQGYTSKVNYGSDLDLPTLEGQESEQIADFNLRVPVGVGFDYRIGRFFSLYLQPGLNYYLPGFEPAEVQSTFINLQPSATTGLRIHL